MQFISNAAFSIWMSILSLFGITTNTPAPAIVVAAHATSTVSVSAQAAATPSPAEVFTGPPTCDVSAINKEGQQIEYVSTRNYNQGVLTVVLNEPITIIVKSTNAQTATGPDGSEITKNGSFSYVPTVYTSLQATYLYTFTGPYGKAVCQLTTKTSNPVALEGNLAITFAVTGNGEGGKIPGSSKLVLALPSNIANTFSDSNAKPQFGFSYSLVSADGVAKGFDNLAFNPSQETAGGPVSVTLSGLPSVSAGTYKVVVTLYTEHTQPGGFEILRTEIGKGESDTFTLP